jgi:DNA-directed RNA polymerase specialized sigma24 family protein
MGRLTDADAHGPTTEDAIIRRERDAAIVDALARTAEDDRTAMLLAAQGYRGEEIAERIGRSELATRTLLCRARGRLRVRLAEGVGA